ncbi:MAG: DNA-directed RNA polymerase subunit beta [Alphaproteobacteria bacterium]|jgi:DNA-directed RNA polymerase subunit beta|nr:DNA-directed RNA polymerase subunit beta [Alphaproteobacteria bacterium]MBT5389714.1 DNA-directed RNA polymerase subunit beta [Alphaproteobacteria bacterium]MBT5654638.1 DNA-directed RNA polymerase subunit beta [Alphaproteobacteria bacterium]
MAKSFTERKRIRKSFGRISSVVPMPNLIQVQKSSYEKFLQTNVSPKKRKNIGLQEVLHSVFPIKDYSGRSQLEFVSFDFGDPKFDVEECQQRDITYAAPLKATLRLVVWDIDEESEARSIRDIKEQDVYLGDIPLMTGNGTFVINGTERVIVSQMHRSPGVFFDHDGGKTHSSGKYLFAARVIPYRGSWLDFEFDAKDLMFVRIDRRRKLPVTSFLMCLDSFQTHKLRLEAEKKGKELDPSEVTGMGKAEILGTFYDSVTYKRNKEGYETEFHPDQWLGIKLIRDLVDAKTGKAVVEGGKKITPRLAKKLQEDGLKKIRLPADDIIGKFLSQDTINASTGEVLAEAGDEISEELLKSFDKAKITSIPVLAIDYINVGPYIRNTLAADKNSNREEALMDVYRVMRPGEPPTLEGAEALFNGLFFTNDRYDLSSVGRVKMNARLGFETEDSIRTLRKDDILAILKILLDLKDGRGNVDDIDNLGNRRIRSVGELLENQLRIGLLRMERSIRERMSSLEIDTVMPHDLINAKPVVGAIREFFGSSQLSQFMDQTNPLSEITHKRRLSALGPGGLTRERAGFEVRDVHPTHYGRICPIETPEGPNIGLINSLSTFARINKYGFIETPYRKVEKKKVTDNVVYLSAMEEERHTIAQSNAELTSDNRFATEFVSCRRQGEFENVPAGDIDLIDVSPKQLVSVAASLIPFLENDDANRALMGSNMQRQAVPLLRVQAPLVGTSMEAAVARDSGATIVAKREGVVDQVDASRIVVQATGETSHSAAGVDIYNLEKFQRSNQDTCINQLPLVKVGDKVKADDIIADGPSTDLGELALGRNVLVAFMSWHGYNFEDSIVISERLVSGDVFTSIHIEEFEVMARDTKLGSEDITRDIPNVGEESLRNLDEAGIVHVGAEVHPGDVLVGKVTPKGESPMTPEEKLLRAIFGEKASDVRDTSLRVSPGGGGTVVDVRVFSRRGIEKDERSLAIEQEEIESLAQDKDAERAILEGSFNDRLKGLLKGEKAVSGPKGLKKGTELKEDVFSKFTKGQWRQIVIGNDKKMKDIESLKKQIDESIKYIEERFSDKVEKIRRGDELLPGVMKMIKVYVAVKRKIKSGDKMAGRHGNKGVISQIVPVEDMPYLEDGTPVDIILNPLGIPSRMNVGQILETHMGWAAAGLGKQIGELVNNVQRNSSDKAKKDEKSVKELRKFLDTVYSDKTDLSTIKAMNDDDLMELGKNLTPGVPMATPVFDGAHESDVIELLKQANLDPTGQETLYDGLTGEKLDRKVTVGYIYILKLHHLVDDKIHARSIGPYSLVTQQPLGGKAQFGGQRFGEMEVWALEAYGAAYTLQEMLTVKSDDVNGRTKLYEAIIRGDTNFEPGIPESFNVLVKELRSLGMDMEFKGTK